MNRSGWTLCEKHFFLLQWPLTVVGQSAAWIPITYLHTWLIRALSTFMEYSEHKSGNWTSFWRQIAFLALDSNENRTVINKLLGDENVSDFCQFECAMVINHSPLFSCGDERGSVLCVRKHTKLWKHPTYFPFYEKTARVDQQTSWNCTTAFWREKNWIFRLPEHSERTATIRWM